MLNHSPQNPMHREYIHEVPESDTVILFVHGILGSPDQFQDFIPLVPKTWSIHNMLLDGHGKKVTDFSHTSMKKWKEQAADKAETLSRKYKNIILAAHSMGTLFAIDLALRWPQQVKMLFLLAVPLKMSLRPFAVSNSMKVIFDKVSAGDPAAMAAKASYSIEPDKRLWKYLRWFPRFAELYSETKRTGKKLCSLSVPCHVYQSGKDELVSRSTLKILAQHPKISVALLENSRHYYYEPADYALLLKEFRSCCNNLSL